MKSAYELAMEKLGKPREFSDEKKAQLAEIDSRYESEKAQVKLGADEELKNAALDPAKQDEIREQLARDLKRFEEQKETEKRKVREGKGSK
jgi:hypothetical protein